MPRIMTRTTHEHVRRAKELLARGMPHLKVACELGISQPTVYKISRGWVPDSVRGTDHLNVPNDEARLERAEHTVSVRTNR